MQTALDRLIARPSTLRVLRWLITQDDLPNVAISAHCLSNRLRLRRTYSNAGSQEHNTQHSDEDKINRNCIRIVPSRIEIRRYPSEWKKEVKPPKHKTATTHKQHNLSFMREVCSPRSPSQRLSIADFPSMLKVSRTIRKQWGRLMKFVKFEEDLPVEGWLAFALWDTALKHDAVLDEIISYALDLKARTGKYYEPLYLAVIQRKLSSNPKEVYSLHNKLWFPFQPPAGTMKRLAVTATQSVEALNQFKGIYLLAGQRDIHDTIMTELLDRGMFSAALDWRTFLNKHNDLPTGRWGARFGPKWTNDKVTSSPSSDSLFRDPERRSFDRRTMYEFVGQANSIEPKKLDDHFCARLFATGAFSTQLVIKGLQMFGVEEIGSLALRELILRKESPNEFEANLLPSKIMDKFTILRDAGMRPSNSVFSQALYIFAKDNQKEKVDWLLTTDMHPDAFEDTDVLKDLVAYNIQSNGWTATQVILSILTLFHKDPMTVQWNMVLRHLAISKDMPMLCRIVQNMQFHRIPFTEDTMSAIQKHVLRPRQKGHRPVATGAKISEDLRLVINIWCHIVSTGGSFDPRRWREIFARLLMTWRWIGARRLAFHILYMYSPGRSRAAHAANLRDSRHGNVLSPESIAAVSEIPTWHPKHPLSQIFSPAQVGSFLAMGIRYGLRHPGSWASKPENTWTRGLVLLKQLKDRGVFVSTSLVKRKLKRELVMLFGPDLPRYYMRQHGPGYSRRRLNRDTRRNNIHPLDEMINQANAVWGKKLLRPQFERSLRESQSDHTIRSRQRRTR